MGEKFFNRWLVCCRDDGGKRELTTPKRRVRAEHSEYKILKSSVPKIVGVDGHTGASKLVCSHGEKIRDLTNHSEVAVTNIISRQVYQDDMQQANPIGIT